MMVYKKHRPRAYIGNGDIHAVYDHKYYYEGYKKSLQKTLDSMDKNLEEIINDEI